MIRSRVGGRGGARNGPHTELVKACLGLLTVRRVPAWKQNTGAVVVRAEEESRKGTLVRFSFPGCADILGILPAQGGRFLAVECKTGSGVLSDDQVAFKELVEGAGGLFIEARSIDDLAVIWR